MSIDSLGNQLGYLLKSFEKDPVPDDPFSPPCTYTDEELHAKVELEPPPLLPSFLRKESPSLPEKLKTLHQRFEEERLALDSHLVIYHKYLFAASDGRTLESTGLTDRQVSDAGKAIQAYHLATHVFLESAKIIPRLGALFRKYFCPKCYLPHARVNQLFRIISLHARLAQYIPIKMIVDVAFERETDPNRINAFIRLLNEEKVETKVWFLGVKAIVENATAHLQSDDHKKLKNAPSLTPVMKAFIVSRTNLHKYDQLKYPELVLFTQKEKAFTIWRENLKKGSVLRSVVRLKEKTRQILHIHTVVLGDRLGTKRNSDVDQRYVFTIQKYGMTVREFEEGEQTFDDVLETVHSESQHQGHFLRYGIVCVPDNVARTDLYVSLLDRHTGLRLPDILFVDPSNQFMIMEKLSQQFCGPNWETEKKDSTTKQNIINYLKHLCTQSVIPNYLHPRFIMRTVNGVMSTFRMVFSGPFKLQRIEQFALDLADGDQELFEEFLRAAEVGKHSHAQFLRRVLLTTFDNTTNLENMTLMVISELKLEESVAKETAAQACELETKMKFLFEDCCQSLQFVQKRQLVPAEKETIKKLLLRIYRSSPAVTLFRPNLKELVIEAYKRDTKDP